MKVVLYIHGMGGGGDSRIPSILSDVLGPDGIDVVVRTYDFDPEIASSQISSWIEELEPSLIVGESLGALHAIRIKGLPHILVSPSLNAPLYFSRLAWLTLVPGVTWMLDRIYRPKEGDRQKLHFTYHVLRKYAAHRRSALDNSLSKGSRDSFHAFFGGRDHYRRTGIVSVRTWKKYFGDSFDMYEGTHFMEEEHVRTVLSEYIIKILGVNK